MLRERGKKLQDGQFEAIGDVDQRIGNLLEQDKERLERPVTAFVTFTTHEAADRCVEHFGSKYNWLTSSD